MKQDGSIEEIITFLSKLQSQLDEFKPGEFSDNYDVQSSETEVKDKRASSWWVRVREGVKKICKLKNKASIDNEGSQSGSNKDSQDQVDDADLEIQKLKSDIRQMKAAFEKLKIFQTTMSKSLEHDLPPNKVAAIIQKTHSIRSRFHDLKEIRRKILDLKCRIPSLLYKQSSSGGLSITDPQAAEENDQIVETGNDIYLPSLHVSGDFRVSPAFEEVVEKFQGLEFTEQLCLLSFAVFPENREVERTMLMYWWIGEGFIERDDPEGLVTRILDDFSTKGLLEPVEDERKLRSSSYKMEPHVHFAVIYLAEFMGLFHLYSPEGKLAMQNKTEKEKVCLVKRSSLQKEAKKTSMKPKSLKTIFNSSERYPDFTFKWFEEMDSLRVLYLGRWERTATRHIEVESTDFLKYMKALKNLKLASFQGISRIEKLHKSICDLRQLVILDLRACYNLESLPDDIGSLDNLIYLDVSECYMLDRMPEGIADLKRLQVLKGFVISESEEETNCAVKHLENLRKLSITVNKAGFKVEYLMESLKGLVQLKTLKIAWGAREQTNKEEIHKDLKEGEDEKVREKGQTSQEKKGDEEETGVGQEDRDGRNEKKQKEIKAERSKSDKVTERETKASPSRESTEMVQKKLNDRKGKSKVEEEGDGNKEKADQEQKKKHEVVEAKRDKVTEGQKKASPSRESTEMVQKKSDDQKGKSKVEEEGDGDKEKADQEQGEKSEVVEAESSKSHKVTEGEKKASPSRESTEMVQKKLDDQKGKGKVEEEGDGDKEKADQEQGKKSEVVEAESSKSDKVTEGEKKASPSRESTEMVQKKLDDQKGKGKVEEEGDGDKEKADQEQGKKSEVVEAESSKLEKRTTPPGESREIIQNKPDDQKGKGSVEEDGDKGKVDLKEGKKKEEGEKKVNPPGESLDTMEKKLDDKSKVEEKGDEDKGNKRDNEVEAQKSKSDNGVEGFKKASPSQESKHESAEKEEDGDKGKVDPKEGNTQFEKEAEKSKSENVVEGVKNAGVPKESTNMVQNKPDDHQTGEKGDGEKEKVNLEEGKKKEEVKAESSKLDKVTPQEYKDTTQRNPDDHKDNREVQEKGDGVENVAELKKLDEGEEITKKSDKNKKLGKKVSFSEELKSMAPKNADERSKAMEEDIHGTTSSTPKLSKGRGSETKRWGIGSETKRWGTGRKPIHDSKLPSNLKKLELECFPEPNPPIWLNPRNLDSLQKLSIKGGMLTKISNEVPFAVNNCGVQILRLKYLHEFKAEWKELQALFPKMILLEKYKCPKVALCPTDGNGIWKSQQQTSPEMPE